MQQECRAGSCRGGSRSVGCWHHPVKDLGWMELELPAPDAIKPGSCVITLVATPSTLSMPRCAAERRESSFFLPESPKWGHLLLLSWSLPFPAVSPGKGFPLNSLAVSIPLLMGEMRQAGARGQLRGSLDLFWDAAGILSPVLCPACEDRCEM